MTYYRLVIREVVGDEMLTSYTRWLECVHKGRPGAGGFVAFSPRFERLCLESRKRSRSTWSRSRPIPRFGVNTHCVSTVGRRSTLRTESETISLEELRRVFGLESIKDAEGNIIQKAPLPVWPNFQQRALDVAILEIAPTIFSERQALISGFL